MTAGLENMNAESTIWSTWHFHISSEYYSLFAMQFQLSQLCLKCLLVLWWGEKSWALKWQMLTDHVSIKNLRPTSFCFFTGKKVLKSCIGHSLDSRVYGWKHGHFARLNRTLWPGFVSAGVITKKVFFQVSMVLWRHGCVTLQSATSSSL